jgi:hypothetical protein
VEALDADGDGFPAQEDCDDEDPAVHPGAPEVCGGIDEDCDGFLDEADPDLDGDLTLYADADGDTWGSADPGDAREFCAQPGSGWVADATDCDDTDPAIHPGVEERCDGVDEDCDGAVDDDAIDADVWYRDADEDGYGDPAGATLLCTATSGYVADDTDCDDTEADIHPGATEHCDGVDEDCDGSVDEDAVDPATWYADGDGDGYGDPLDTAEACTPPSGYVADGTDCDVTDASIHPGAPEHCDGVDEDCDGTVDEGAADAPTWYADADGDGYGDPLTTLAACTQPSGTTADARDCDDGQATIHPGADERCDGVDEDCDGVVDEDALDAATWFSDSDGDGYGDPLSPVLACTAPAGAVSDDRDCDDGDTGVNPGAMEHCDGVDEDCDGRIDDGAVDWRTWYADGDGDGFGDAAVSITTCTPPSGYVADDSDCDDAQAGVNPDADEHCDGVDEDCDGLVDDAPVDPETWYTDADGDGFGLTASATTACTRPSGTAADPGDCDDTDAQVHPGAVEHCDGVDEDCDGSTDEGAVDMDTWYPDGDGDGFGLTSGAVVACTQPSGTATAGGDCDDGSSAIHPGASEHCDGVDEDCDGSIDEGAPGSGTWYTDADGDGYGDTGGAVSGCTQPSGTVATGTDCDDTDAGVFPGATEHCDGVDEDCDGSIDEGAVGMGTWYADSDGDGYGAVGGAVTACTQPSGTATTGTDCDDTSASIHPGATEHCDGVDEDCDGSIDEGAVDAGTWYTDADGDGYGTASSAVVACTQPAASSPVSTDCNDGSASIHPGALEHCDGVDEDCDGLVDESAFGASTWYPDADGDGYGTTTGSVRACTAPTGYAATGSDCDDTDAAVHPGATEVCNGEDDDCNGTIDGSGLVTFVTTGGTVTNWSTAFASGTSTAAYTASLTSSGTLSVCPGTYYVEIQASGADISIIGPYGSASTTLRSDASGSVVTAASTCTDLYVEGLTLYAGGTATYGASFHGGSHGLRAVLDDVVLEHGTASYGGCFYQSAGTVDATDIAVQSCSATGNGGGMYLSSVTLSLTSSDLDGNTATSSGGGLYTYGGTATLDDVLFSGNTASASSSPYGGGGAYLASGTTTITDSTFTANLAYRGGGLMVYGGSATLTTSEIDTNTAWSRGGGLYAYSSTVSLSYSTVHDNTCSYSGGGLYLYYATVACYGSTSATAGVYHNTASSYGGGAYVSDYGTLTSSVCDWGSGTSDNSPSDVAPAYGSATSAYGSDASFTCNSLGCY